MTDVFSPAKRSAIMSRIKGVNTRPEILVRKLVHSQGYRFRLHSNRVAGKPDLVFPRHKKIIFVHGCFWHGHGRCSRAALPASNIDFWQKKIDGNKIRDSAVRRKLNREGWTILVVWQCQTKNVEDLQERIGRFLAE